MAPWQAVCGAVVMCALAGDSLRLSPVVTDNWLISGVGNPLTRRARLAPLAKLREFVRSMVMELICLEWKGR